MGRGGLVALTLLTLGPPVLFLFAIFNLSCCIFYVFLKKKCSAATAHDSCSVWFTPSISKLLSSLIF
jgi:hypothetical protein